MATKTNSTTSFDIFKPIKKISKRFHLTVFFVFIVACLAGAVLIINYTLKESTTDPNYVSPISTGSIDQVTLDRINALHRSTEIGPEPVLPAGRINPVGE
jgi:hypothetical protein